MYNVNLMKIEITCKQLQCIKRKEYIANVFKFVHNNSALYAQIMKHFCEKFNPFKT